MAQAANTSCEMCVRALGLHYCTQCDQVFCDDCKMSHLRARISKNHTFMTGLNINMEKKAGGCTDHNEEFIYLCEDCNQLVCRLCVTKAHRKHDLVDIKDSNKKVQTEISKYLDSKVHNVRSSAKLIEGKAKTYKTEVEATVKVIIEHGNLIKAMVDKKVDALIKALRERESIELQSLSKANTDCNDLLGEATRQQQMYQDMIKQYDEAVLFQKMKILKSDINNLKSVDVTSLPPSTYNRKNVNFSDVEKLFGNLTFQ
jgi:cupin superfamily acireductone dioxygenase involved in methionine salvage